MDFCSTASGEQPGLYDVWYQPQFSRLPEPGSRGHARAVGIERTTAGLSKSLGHAWPSG